jgi:uncharacterized membrane protein YqgA involved in biofilm formation
LPLIQALSGTLVNTAAVLVGGGLGVFVGARLPERLREQALRAIGLAVIWIGLGMALGSHVGTLLVIASLALGALVGEWIDIEGHLTAWTKRAEVVGSGASRAFVLASLIFCVGPLSILGAIQNGLTGQPDLLLAKSVLDGITGLLFASAMGAGVLLAAGTVLVYQGLIAVLASAARHLLDRQAMAALTGVGGLLIVAIGLSLCEIGKLRPANLLPALVLAVVAAAVAGAHGYTIP